MLDIWIVRAGFEDLGMDGKHHLMLVEVESSQFLGRICGIYDHLFAGDLKQNQIKTLTSGVRPVLFPRLRIICMIAVGSGALVAIAVQINKGRYLHLIFY
jgi:hypothetical protein